MLAILFIFCVLANQESPELGIVVEESFAEVHNGYSSDEVLLDDALNKKFVAECRKRLPEFSTTEFNWTLINLRKAGKLSHIKTTKRKQSKTEPYRFLAEIVARSVLDQEQVSIDRVFSDPMMREQFDNLAVSIQANADLYLVRKAAFRLRKSRKLQPELITRIADWGREISTFSIAQIRQDPKKVPANPGIYIFHNASGYLYIGQSENLRERLAEHLDSSSNVKLAGCLDAPKSTRLFVEVHAFPNNSRANEVKIRRAYESELIRSRKPKFNILP